MIARVIFGLRRYVHSPLIVKGYSVNRLPVFLSPLSPPPHPSASRGEGKVGVGLFATGTAPSSSPLPSPPPHGPLHWESNGHPGGEGGGWAIRYGINTMVSDGTTIVSPGFNSKFCLEPSRRTISS